MHNNTRPWKHGASLSWSGIKYLFQCGVFLLALGIFFSFGRKRHKRLQYRKHRPTPPPKTSPQKPKATQEPKAPTQDKSIRRVERQPLKKALALSFPRGGKVALDPQKDTPFILKVTAQNTSSIQRLHSYLCTVALKNSNTQKAHHSI